MYKLAALACSAFVAVPSLFVPAWSRSMEAGDAAIVRRDEPAVVNISTWKVKPPEKPGDSPTRVKVDASGFVIEPSGIIVTNKHVVDGALGFTAIFSNGDRLHARLLVAAEMLDLALLKVDVDHPIPSLKWGNSDAIQVGDPVLTIGNPLGLGMSASGGIVSALNRDLQDSPFDSYIQSDASLNHGNSGGPLIDRNGDVVGINTALYNPEDNGGFIGIGFAIPSNTANFVEHFLLNPNHPKPGWLGFTLQDMTQELSLALGTPSTTGAIISALDGSGPANAASLRIGDVLESINGTQLSDSRAFNRAIVMMAVGQPANLTVWRDGQQREITATVAAWPNYMPNGGMMHGTMADAMMAKPPDSGMKLAALTDETRKQYDLAPTETGAVITYVDQDCEAKDLGIVPGDVIISAQGEPITSPADFDHAVQGAHTQQRRYLALLIRAKQGTHWVALSITTAGS
jgi:serine protease Do